MTARLIHYNKPFFITKRDDGFVEAYICDGKFIGWRERGSHYKTLEEAWKIFEEVFGYRPDLTVGECL